MTITIIIVIITIIVTFMIIVIIVSIITSNIITRHQLNTLANVNPDLCRHRASLDHNRIIISHWVNIVNIQLVSLKVKYNMIL